MFFKFRRTIDEDCPLCDYVYEDDGFYDFFLYDHEVQDGCDTYYLNLTSQKWFDGKYIDGTIDVWKFTVIWGKKVGFMCADMTPLISNNYL